MDRCIIITADDFGLCAGVNKAVALAHTKGVLTSASLMANMPNAEEAVSIAKKLPSLGVGLHLNVIQGGPLSKEKLVGCLADSNGRFTYSLPKLLFLASVSARIRKAIRTEFETQIQWLISRGINPTHLDSHKHIHSFPFIYPMVCELARKYGIEKIRRPFEPAGVCRPPWPKPTNRGRAVARKLRITARINRLQNPVFLKNDALLGIAHTGSVSINYYEVVSLHNPFKTVEIMTHPGLTDGLDAMETRLVRQREVEFEALCSDKTKQYFKNSDIKLVHYGNL
jgi:hopanoid biosynthesis associated protein HpnK